MLSERALKSLWFITEHIHMLTTESNLNSSEILGKARRKIPEILRWGVVIRIVLLKDASLMLKQPNSTHNHVVIENTFFLSWKKFEIELRTTCYHCTKSITMLDRNKIVTSLVQFWHLIISFVCLWKSGLFFLVIKME